MHKKKDGDPSQAQADRQGQAELFELSSFKKQVAPAVYAGVMEQEGWLPDKELSAEEFERAVTQFMST